MRLILAAVLLTLFVPSCATEDEEGRKPTGPVSTSRQIPWNEPRPGQGGGALGALPQTPRR
jgi:hypothetical protein